MWAGNALSLAMNALRPLRSSRFSFSHSVKRQGFTRNFKCDTLDLSYSFLLDHHFYFFSTYERPSHPSIAPQAGVAIISRQTAGFSINIFGETQRMFG